MRKEIREKYIANIYLCLEFWLYFYFVCCWPLDRRKRAFYNRTRACRNACFKYASRVSKWSLDFFYALVITVCQCILRTLVHSEMRDRLCVGVHSKSASVLVFARVLALLSAGRSGRNTWHIILLLFSGGPLLGCRVLASRHDAIRCFTRWAKKSTWSHSSDSQLHRAGSSGARATSMASASRGGAENTKRGDLKTTNAMGKIEPKRRPKGPFRTKYTTAPKFVVFCYRRSFSLHVPLLLGKQAFSVWNLLPVPTSLSVVFWVRHAPLGILPDLAPQDPAENHRLAVVPLRSPYAIGSVIGRPYLALSRIHKCKSREFSTASL